MVVLKINIDRFVTQPAKRDPEISAHSDRPPLRLALKSMEAHTGDIHVFRLSRRFQQLQDTNALPQVLGPNPAACSSGADLLQSLVAEAPNHPFKLPDPGRCVN